MASPMSKTSAAWKYLALLTAANFLGYAARNALFSAYQQLRQHFPVDDGDLGFLATAFMGGQAIATLPVGWAGDRFNRKHIIVAGLLLAGIAGVIGTFANGLPMLIASRIFVGIGCAVIVPISNSILSQLFEGPNKASRIAVFNLGMFIGGAVGVAGGDSLGYPWILLIIGAPTVVIALLVSQADIATAPRSSKAESSSSVVADVAAILRISPLRWLIAAATVMSFAVGGLMAWLIEFLKREKGMSAGNAKTLLVAAMVGGLAGVVVGARVGDAWRQRWRWGRAATMTFAMFMTAPLIAGCMLAPNGFGLYLLGVVGMFFLSWYHAPLAALVDELVNREQSATAQAMVVFTMHLLGTALAPWLIGQISDTSNLTTAMWIPTGAIAVAALLMAMTTRSVRMLK
jgi:MFS transporter, Spinster family, sphingosine-1-phosphate transporter